MHWNELHDVAPHRSVLFVIDSNTCRTVRNCGFSKALAKTHEEFRCSDSASFQCLTAFIFAAWHNLPPQVTSSATMFVFVVGVSCASLQSCLHMAEAGSRSGQISTLTVPQTPEPGDTASHRRPPAADSKHMGRSFPRLFALSALSDSCKGFYRGRRV